MNWQTLQKCGFGTDSSTRSSLETLNTPNAANKNGQSPMGQSLNCSLGGAFCEITPSHTQREHLSGWFRCENVVHGFPHQRSPLRGFSPSAFKASAMRSSILWRRSRFRDASMALNIQITTHGSVVVTDFTASSVGIGISGSGPAA